MYNWYGLSGPKKISLFSHYCFFSFANILQLPLNDIPYLQLQVFHRYQEEQRL